MQYFDRRLSFPTESSTVHRPHPSSEKGRRFFEKIKLSFTSLRRGGITNTIAFQIARTRFDSTAPSIPDFRSVFSRTSVLWRGTTEAGLESAGRIDNI